MVLNPDLVCQSGHARIVIVQFAVLHHFSEPLRVIKIGQSPVPPKI